MNQGVVRGVIEGGPDKDRREEKAIETLAIQSRETFLQKWPTNNPGKQPSWEFA